jgi:hypothetical protein
LKSHNRCPEKCSNIEFHENPPGDSDQSFSMRSDRLEQTNSRFSQYFAGDKIEKNDMGGTCGIFGGRERCAQGFGGETRGKETTAESNTQMGG